MSVIGIKINARYFPFHLCSRWQMAVSIKTRLASVFNFILHYRLKAIMTSLLKCKSSMTGRLVRYVPWFHPCSLDVIFATTVFNHDPLCPVGLRIGLGKGIGIMIGLGLGIALVKVRTKDQCKRKPDWLQMTWHDCLSELVCLWQSAFGCQFLAVNLW